MRKYEVMFVLRQEEERYAKVLEEIRGHLANFSAEIIKDEDFGHKALAYPIKKQTHAHYHLITLNFPPEKVVEIGNLFKLNTDILKFLFILLED